MAREAKTEVATKRRSRVDVAEPAEAAAPAKKTRVSRKAAAEAVAAVFDPYSSIDKELEVIERDCALVSAGVDVLEDRVSTGLLQVDLILCGGVVGGGWYTNFGPEQSTKTTGAIAVLATALLQGVPIIYYFDYENSFQPDYFEKVVSTLFRSVGKTPLTTDEIFGVRDSKGVWVKPPRIRIYQDSIAEKFFNSVSRLLKTLPQKRKIGESWYYVYEDSKENRAKVGTFYDKAYYQKTKTFRVPAQDSKPQALVLVDSYPAMLPELIDEKDEGGNAGGLAVQARMFSDNIKRVKGRMRSRRVTVLGINQLRTNPGARFSNPEYEPGGDALKFYCFHGETLLYTSEGLLKANEVAGVPKKMAGVKGGEKPAAFFQVGRHATMSVITEHGFSMRGRAGHHVYALRQGERKAEWVRLDKLTREHFVAVRHSTNLWPKKDHKFAFVDHIQKGQNGNTNRRIEFTIPKNVSPEFARLAGYLVSEGHIRNGVIDFSMADVEVFEDFLFCFSSSFGVTVESLRQFCKKQATFWTFRLYSEQLAQFFRHCGMERPSSEKEIPYCIRSSSQEIMTNFLRALYEGDGHINGRAKSCEVSYASSSQTLIKQLAVVMLNYGIVGKSALSERKWHEAMNENVVSELHFYGKHATEFLKQIGFLSVRKVARAEARLEIEGSGVSMFDQLPVLSHRVAKRRAVRARKHVRVGEVIDFDVSVCRTSQERDANSALVSEINAISQESADNCLVWSRVDSIVANHEPSMTYDCNMPKTSTVITSGIVSHNSDVRLRYYSRALSGVPYVKATSGQIEEESSVEGKGNDTYRYVHVRAHKNKLSTPGLEGWVRVWISDRKGKARGYCPVWDTFIYLENTGQIKSSAKSERKNLSFNLRRLNAEGQVVKIKYTGECIDWLTFKRWVLGTKEEIAEICERLGFKKPFRLRKFCFDQMASSSRLPDGTLLGSHLYFSKMYDDGTEVEPGEEDGDPHHVADDE